MFGCARVYSLLGPDVRFQRANQARQERPVFAKTQLVLDGLRSHLRKNASPQKPVGSPILRLHGWMEFLCLSVQNLRACSPA